jgi:hypothetical protein
MSQTHTSHDIKSCHSFALHKERCEVVECLNPVWRMVRIPPPQSPRVVRGDKKGTVSDETVMYGYWPTVTGLDL